MHTTVSGTAQCTTVFCNVLNKRNKINSKAIYSRQVFSKSSKASLQNVCNTKGKQLLIKYSLIRHLK